MLIGVLLLYVARCAIAGEWSEASFNDIQTFLTALERSSKSDQWNLIFGCGDPPFVPDSSSAVYVRDRHVFSGRFPCGGDFRWVTKNVRSDSMTVVDTYPQDGIQLPTTTLPTTTLPPTTTVITTSTTPPPTTMTIAGSRPTFVEDTKTTAKNPGFSSTPSQIKLPVVTPPKKDVTDPPLSTRPNSDPPKPTMRPVVVDSWITNDDPYEVSYRKLTDALSTTKSPLSGVCPTWNIIIVKVNPERGTVVYHVQCFAISFQFKIFFVLRSDRNGRLSSFYSETDTENIYSVPWIELTSPVDSKADPIDSVAPDSYVKGVVDEQCVQQSVDMTYFYNQNLPTTVYTRVICSRMVEKNLYIKAFTPSDSTPRFINIYRETPFYVQEVYNSVFSIYRTVYDARELTRVKRDVVVLSDVIKSRLPALGCGQSEFTFLKAHMDPKDFTTGYFLEIYCGTNVTDKYYVEYEKPDEAETRTSLEKVNSVPDQLSSATRLPHKLWKSSSKDGSSFLQTVLNFQAAVSYYRCVNFRVIFFYEKGNLDRMNYLAVVFCPNVGQVYYVMALALSDSWFKPVLMGPFTNSPPPDFKSP